MNEKASPNRAYNPTPIEHIANVVTHGVSVFVIVLKSRYIQILFSKEGHLLSRSRIEREKFYPGLGLEPGSLAFHANALTS